ncbi:hypothetical protein ABZX39_33230 [Streptomyces collinus]|uniref:hypothetical protein n=1 Tax=Streptomyces collinus TaxID=42684 RepID=UPI0033B5252D
MPATATKPRIVYPRPPIVVLHADLFREAVYEDGEPYGDQDDDEDDEPSGLPR